jgi:hypothetical protein
MLIPVLDDSLGPGLATAPRLLAEDGRSEDPENGRLRHKILIQSRDMKKCRSTTFLRSCLGGVSNLEGYRIILRPTQHLSMGVQTKMSFVRDKKHRNKHDF